MSSTPNYLLARRQGPLVISIPHLGRTIPQDLRGRYSSRALELEDTDWHLDRLYAFAEQLGATVIAATVSRYVIDLNRPATGESLYPGMISTALCPTETFRGEALYEPGQEPDGEEIELRTARYWQPYHTALKTELARLRDLHPNVLLWEAHSIASVLPRLFDGKLNDFNFGTSDGQSCAPKVAAGAIDAVRDSEWSWVLNGRFKGGFITRRYGEPAAGVHAVQLEMSQDLYMDETAPFAWRMERAAPVSSMVQASVEGALRAVSGLSSRISEAALPG